MDEGVDMDEFNSCCSLQSPCWVAADGFAGSQYQQGAKAFSAGEEGIAHGLVEGGGFGGGFGEEAIEGVINFLEMRLDVDVEIHKAGGGVSGGRRG